MLRLLFVILAAAMATMFAMDNMQRVELGLIVGRPVHVRLFFLLLTSFLIGCFSAILLNLYLRANSKQERKGAADAEDDEFFLE